MLQIPSDKVPFNQKPDMKAYEITEAGKEAMRSGKYQMVGHIAVFDSVNNGILQRWKVCICH